MKSAGALTGMEAATDFEEYYEEQIFSSAAPPYKPPDYPELSHRDLHICADCGDRFILESSLNFHLSRKSVEITYFCKQCDERLYFQNRCSLLAHLRQHPERKENALSIIIAPLPVDSSRIITYEKNTLEVSDVIEGNVQLRDKNIALEKDPLSNGESVQITGIKAGEVKVLITESQKTNLSNNHVKCRECGTDVENLKTHFLGDNKPSNPLIKCQSCEHILPTKCNLKAHMRIHLKKFPFVCPDCMKEFAFFELFMVHLRYFCFHLDKCARFKCQACPGIFPSLTSLEVHLATKHVKPVFKCLACPRAFFEQKLLNDHKVQSHGNVKIPTKFFEQCQLCPQKLLTKNCLFYHIHEHVMNKNVCFYCYKCTNCKYITDTKLNFASHRLTCPSSEKDANAHALAKLAKSSLSGEGENSCLANSKKPIAVCYPNVSNSSSSDQITSQNQEKGKNTLSTNSRALNAVSNRNLSSNTMVCHQQKILKKYMFSGFQKPCYWHPDICLMCQNEVTLGSGFAQFNCPSIYKGCQKWKEGSLRSEDNDGQEKSLTVSKIKKSNRKNCMAFNGPSNRWKLPSSFAEGSTYLCHICKHSVQMNHSIIQKHFRQQHPDVELMSLYPLTYKFKLPKLNIPLESLKFSLRKCKFYQTITVKAKTPSESKTIHKTGSSKLMKFKQSMLQSHNSLKNWLVCSKCKFKTKTRISYKKHMASHRTTPYECPECGLQFVVEPSLKKHFILHHGNAAVSKEVKRVQSNEGKGLNAETSSNEKLSCKVCKKTFENGVDLHKHFRVHGMAFLLLNKDEKIWRKV